MAKSRDPESLYTEYLLERTRRLRREHGFRQADMANFLSIPLERYKKYEKRSPLPHYLIGRFCIACGVSIEYFITGQERERLLPLAKPKISA